MAVNKVVYGTTVLVDLTADTVNANSLLTGYTAHDKSGVEIHGNVTVQKCYTGHGAPSASLGSNNDIYIDLG